MLRIDKVLVFNISGDYAHFRRGYTTTSPLTYPFPTRTALAGLVSAILGLPRDSYYKLFRENNSAFALQILNPIKKIRIGINLIDTKYGLTPWEIQRKRQAPRTQILFEFIKKPKYRIYVWLEDSRRFKEVVDLVNERKCIYTPYLGISECIANFDTFGKGIFEVERKLAENTPVEIHSVVKKERMEEIKLEEGKKYGIVKVPGFMNEDRSVSQYIEFYYEENGKSLTMLIKEYYTLKRENVNLVFF